MRILITGTSPMQCGRTNRYHYGNILDLYARALREGGHTVDHRVWTPGDDLTIYDVAIVGLVPFNSIAARHVYTVCDVIYRARSSNVGLLFAVDDYNFKKIKIAASSLSKDVATRLFTTIKGRTDREWGETAGLPMIEACVTALATRVWPTTIIPAFTWGDHDKLDHVPASNTIYVDPTAIQLDDYATLPRAADDASRRREWMLGTLSDQRPWLETLGLEWPVTYVGSKPSHAEMTVKEPELVAQLGQMWGSLSFPQRHSGGGWYRCRFVYSATAHAVLCADPAEVAPLGGPYLVGPHEVEQLTDAQLATLAADQRQHLFSHSPSRQELITVLDDALRGALLGPVKQPAPVSLPTAPVPDRSVIDDELAEDDVETVQPVRREAARRDEREFDQTYLRANKHGTRVHRDYAAHFFRWGWATRLIKPTDTVLDVGCGPDLALPTVLSMGGRYVPARYVGVDLNKLSGGPGWAELLGETNVLDLLHGERGEQEGWYKWFTKVVAFEVIEHMTRENGIALLEIIYEVLEPGGQLLLSTPVFNGKAAVNHVHEWEIDELRTEIKAAGFTIEKRHGTFASYKDIKRVASPEHLLVLDEIRTYYSEEVTACFLAPLYPDESRNNVWLCRKKEV